jgi:hypothetical protein
MGYDPDAHQVKTWLNDEMKARGTNFPIRLTTKVMQQKLSLAEAMQFSFLRPIQKGIKMGSGSG